MIVFKYIRFTKVYYGDDDEVELINPILCQKKEFNMPGSYGFYYLELSKPIVISERDLYD